MRTTTAESTSALNNTATGTNTTTSSLTCNAEAPELTSVQLSTFNTTGATVNGAPISSPDGLPDPICKSSSSLGQNETGTSSSSNSSLLAQEAVIDNPPEPVVFRDPEPATAEAAGIVDAYAIPTYSVPDEPFDIFVPPAFKIPMGDGNYFLASPVLDEIYPGLKVNLIENVQVSSVVVLLSSLLVNGFVGTSFSQNQTNMTSMQENQTQPQQKPPDSGTASGLENLTGGSSGNLDIFQNGTDIGSKNTSGGMAQEQLK